MYSKSRQEITNDIAFRFLREFPELQSKYDEEIAAWAPDRPGLINLFDIVFEPFVTSHLKTGDAQGQRAIALLNELASEGNAYVREALICSIAESWVGIPEVLDFVIPRLNDEFARIVVDVRDWRP